MSSRRPPLAVYSARRRQRSFSNPHTRPVPSSSPLKQLGEQDADLSVEEMSRRMMKRSRSSLKRSHSGPDSAKAASVGTSPVDPRDPHEEARPIKKPRMSTRTPLKTIVEPGHNNQDMLVDEGTVDMDLTSTVAQLKTPVPREDAAQAKQDEAAGNEESDFLSPLPTSHSAKQNKSQKPAAVGANMPMSPAPNDLASPFHSRPNHNKKLNRTRSVGTDLRRRATMRSFSRAVSPTSDVSSPAIHRHPSLPNSHTSQKKENQDWFVPAQLKQAAGHKSHTKHPEPSVPFVRESSFFNAVPDACSTPVPKNRTSVLNAPPPTPGPARNIDATPRLPLSLRNISQDSIFSSDLDFSASVTVKQTVQTGLPAIPAESLTLAPPSSPAAAPILSPSSSDGDELRDMFSILGLDEDDQHFAGSSESASIVIKAKKLKGTKTSARTRGAKQAVTGHKRQVASAAGARKRGAGTLPSSSSNIANKINQKPKYQRPTLKMKILDQPIQISSTSDDELDFLTSHGTPLIGSPSHH
ncbi:hypothetical protein DFH11DRAFT_1690532 [Phellopilus nigrolimitatus]|nr:hypothetical protein DFH11DRAFT_1690532 [Phellopilus nigrolimitatus]